MNQQAIENFREYLRIPSVHPDINYEPCVVFLEKQAKSLGLPCAVHYCHPKNPIVIISWVGKEQAAPSILLNSHMDVVPVFEDKWKYKPFDAHIDEHGNIFARGSQDMKCVGIQYLEAVRRLKAENVVLKRTLHISFVPDEEVGGILGMQDFVKTDEFRNLNVGFALDEGIASIGDVMRVFYGERTIWQFKLHCPGQTGHGALLLDNTAGEKVRYLMDKFSDFRCGEKKKLENDPKLTIGDVTTVNVTMLSGGVQPNVIPEEFVVGIDSRIAVTTNLNEWESMINSWCEEAGKDIWVEYIRKNPCIPVTKIDDTNIYWTTFQAAFEDLGLKMKTEIFPAGTDSRFLRELGIPAIGFSPINNTPILLHDHDEFLNSAMFLRGIEIYCKLLTKVANV